MAYDITQFSFNKETKVLSAEASSLGMMPGRFPRSFEVFSPNTGRTVKFEYDQEAAEANEFWDGEMVEYRPTIALPNVKTIVVFND